MSTDTPTLGDFVADEEPAPAADSDRPQWCRGEADGPRCGGCGTPLTRFTSRSQARDIVRVVGVDGAVPACPECVETRYEGHEVATITMAVELARQRGDGR